MYHRLRTLVQPVLVAGLLLLTGCLTIEENYTFKKDGSGTLEYVIDMSDFAEIMKAMEGASESMGEDEGLGEMDLKEEALLLKGIPGISKVKTKTEQDGFVQRLSFKFKDLNALNQALSVLQKDSASTPHSFYAWDGSTLVRTGNGFASEVGSDLAVDEDSTDAVDPSSILKSMHYKFSFTFPTAVGEVAIAEGVVREDPSPKQLKLDTDWSVIMNDPKALDLRINVP